SSDVCYSYLGKYLMKQKQDRFILFRKKQKLWMIGMIGEKTMDKYLIPTQWDKRTFHIDTYDLTDASEEALQATGENEGHFTLKVDPYHNPENIIKHGFYYMDSLTEPVCKKENLHKFNREGTAISQTYDRKTILQIAEETFMYGRFHLDFHIPD